MDRHLRQGTLVRFGQGLTTRHQNRTLVRHLLAGCRACQAFTSRLLRGEGDYTAAFERAWRAAEQLRLELDRERSRAPELLRALIAQPQERRIAAVAASSAWRSWALCEAVLDASQEWTFHDPARALHMARLGVGIASRLDTVRYGGERVNDLLARAWAVLGNAERVRTDFQAAERCFEPARRCLRAGTGDPLERARVLLLEASLRGRQRRMTEAFRLLDRAADIGRRLGDPVLRGKARVIQGILAGTESEWERAAGLLRQGISLLGPHAGAEPRLWVSAHHNLALILTESGRHREGMEILERMRPLYLQLGDRLSLIRLRWLEGHVQMALGDLARAEDLFLEVREELIRHELGHDVGLLLLDLARVYTRQGKAVHLRRIAGEMLAIFRSRRVPDEVLSALILFRRAAEMEGITLGLIQELSDTLRDGRASAGSRLRESP